jgi:predicted nucleic acid-binding protein
MASTGGNRVFVDTYVLVYAQSSLDPRQAAAASKVVELLQAGDELWISTQVLREYLSAMSRPVLTRPAVPAPALLADISRFESQFHVAEESKGVFNNLRALLSRFRWAAARSTTQTSLPQCKLTASRIS